MSDETSAIIHSLIEDTLQAITPGQWHFLAIVDDDGGRAYEGLVSGDTSAGNPSPTWVIWLGYGGEGAGDVMYLSEGDRQFIETAPQYIRYLLKENAELRKAIYTPSPDDAAREE